MPRTKKSETNGSLVSSDSKDKLIETLNSDKSTSPEELNLNPDDIKLDPENELVAFASQSTGILPWKIKEILVADLLTGDGKKSELIKSLALEEKEKVKIQMLEKIELEKKRKQYEIDKLILEAQAVTNGLI